MFSKEIEANTFETNGMIDQSPELAISEPNERVCRDAQTKLGQESIDRFYQAWAEVGKAILIRRQMQ